MEYLRVMGFVDDHIDENTAREFLMQTRSREIHVARNVLSGLYRNLADQMLGTAALMSRHDVLVSVEFLHSGFEVVEIAAACVCLIAQHHSRPLSV